MLKVDNIVGTITPAGNFVKGGASVVSDKVHDIISFFITALIIVAVIMLIYNGLMFVISGGDTNKVEKAIQGIIYALIGLGIAMAAGLVVGYLGQFLQ